MFDSVHFTQVIIATNIAESSLTVPGVRYVIDLGLARERHYDPLSQVRLDANGAVLA
jgi:HrpA-like RNA helicase